MARERGSAFDAAFAKLLWPLVSFPDPFRFSAAIVAYCMRVLHDAVKAVLSNSVGGLHNIEEI